MKMRKMINYYKKYPTCFLEDVYGIKLTKRQKVFVDNTSRIQDLCILYSRPNFRTLKELEEYLEKEISQQTNDNL